jgi:uncharacterized protein involved in exopolysaccharide biosynthesis
MQINPKNSIKGLIDLVVLWAIFYLKKWKVWLMSGLLGGVLGLFVAIFYVPDYQGQLVFVLTNDDAKTGSGISGLASQFGLDIGGGSSSAFSGENIITLMRSKKIIKLALFNKVPNTNNTLANLYIEIVELKEKMKNKPQSAKIFPLPNKLNMLNPIQDSLLSEICDEINEHANIITRLDKKQNFYSIVTKTKSELLAAHLPMALLNETAIFYTQTKTGQSRKNLAMLQREADSLRNILDESVVSTSSNADRVFNLNSALQVQRSKVQQGQLMTTALATAYGEVLKNLEIAKINLQKETPLFQLIDQPIVPLKLKKLGKLKSLVIGGFLIGFLSICFLTIKRYYKGEV